jgi:hypothetical protein
MDTAIRERYLRIWEWSRLHGATQVQPSQRAILRGAFPIADLEGAFYQSRVGGDGDDPPQWRQVQDDSLPSATTFYRVNVREIVQEVSSGLQGGDDGSESFISGIPRPGSNGMIRDTYLPLEQSIEYPTRYLRLDQHPDVYLFLDHNGELWYKRESPIHRGRPMEILHQVFTTDGRFVSAEFRPADEHLRRLEREGTFNENWHMEAPVDVAGDVVAGPDSLSYICVRVPQILVEPN